MTASVPVDFTSLKLGDESVEEAVITPVAEGFVVDLPTMVRRSELIELSFSSTIYQNQTRFDLFLGNSNLGTDVRQLVDQGDAKADVPSESVSVQLPINDLLLANVTLSTPVLTPNGDGIGDELVIEFERAQVGDAAADPGSHLRLGRPQHAHPRQRRWACSALPLHLGWSRRRWCAREAGTYLVQIEIAGDSETETVQRIVPVAY